MHHTILNIITDTASGTATLRNTSATLDSKWKKLEETLDDYMRLLHQQDPTGADDAVTGEFNKTFKAKNRFEDQYQEHRIKLQVKLERRASNNTGGGEGGGGGGGGTTRPPTHQMKLATLHIPDTDGNIFTFSTIRYLAVAFASIIPMPHCRLVVVRKSVN